MFYKIYTNLSSEIITYSKLLIKDTECKHIAINTPVNTAKIFQERASIVNYEYCFMSLKSNYNINDNHKYVQHMVETPNFRPAKYVIDKNGRIWTDNTHTSLSIMVRNGIFASINSADYFFIDLREENIIFQPNYLPILPNEIYSKIIFNALKIQQRIDNGWRPISLSYTLENLYLYDNYNILRK